MASGWRTRTSHRLPVPRSPSPGWRAWTIERRDLLKVVVVGRTALGAGGQREAGGRGGRLLSVGRPLHREGRLGPAGDHLADGIEGFGPAEGPAVPRPLSA